MASERRFRDPVARSVVDLSGARGSDEVCQFDLMLSDSYTVCAARGPFFRGARSRFMLSVDEDESERREVGRARSGMGVERPIRGGIRGCARHRGYDVEMVENGAREAGAE